MAGRGEHNEKANRGGMQEQTGAQPGGDEDRDHVIRAGENTTTTDNYRL